MDRIYNEKNEMQISERSCTGFQQNLWNFYGHLKPDYEYIRKKVW